MKKIDKKIKLKRQYTISVVSLLVLCVVLIVLIISLHSTTSNQNTITTTKVNAAGQIVWQQFDGNAEKSGTNNDPYINKATVTTLHKMWQVPDTSDSSPVYLSGVTTAQGVKNLVFTSTKGGSLLALDEATGAQIWNVTTSGGSGTITSSPAIDPDNLFIYSYGKDGKVHKYDVGTGNEETAGGWPLTATLIPNVEKGSSSLTIGNGNLYVATSAYPGDNGPYVGHIIAKNLSTGAISIFNTACSSDKVLLNDTCASRQSGIWSRPGAVVDVNTGNVFITSGNGQYAPPNDYGDSVIELSPDLSKIIDTYTPTTFQQLQNTDADLGSAVVGMIPSLELGIQGGKDNKIRVLNLKNLSGQGGSNHTGGELQVLPVNCNIFSHPISWADGSNTMWVFVTDMCSNLYAYKIINNQLQQVYAKNGSGGSSPLMVNGVLFIQSNGAIKAVDPTTGTILWTGQVGSMHWQSPAIVNGHIFVIDNNNLTAFAVPNNTPTIALTTPGNPTPSGFVCLGSCPTPTPSLNPTNPVVQPTISTSVPSPTSSINPCTALAATQNAGQTQIYRHKHHASLSMGLIQQLLQFLLQLLQLLFQQLGVPTQTPTPTPNPVTPIPTTANGNPTSTPIPCPQTAPTMTVAPTSSVSTTPITITPITTPTQTGTNTAVCPAVVDPAYFYPPTYWPELLSSKDPPSSVGLIFNPASGPGTQVYQNLLAQAQKAKAAGMPIYAYVDTSYGKKSISTVEADVTAYKNLYGITGIMFDQMSSSSTEFSYYQTLINFVHSSASGSKVILNPGTYPDQSYMNLDATFTVFEGPYTSFVNDTVPSYAKTTPANKMSVVVYATPVNNLTAALQLAQQRNAGMVYVTDNTNTGNPYNTLPAYWTTELSQITTNCTK